MKRYLILQNMFNQLNKTAEWLMNTFINFAAINLIVGSAIIAIIFILFCLLKIASILWL